MRIEWKFNLERAPWWGGFFERMVGIVKGCLRKVLRNARLTKDEIYTVLVEIEGTLNSRPLTYDYDIQLRRRSASHLTCGRRIQSLPDANVREIDEEEENRSCSASY